MLTFFFIIIVALSAYQYVVAKRVFLFSSQRYRKRFALSAGVVVLMGQILTDFAGCKTSFSMDAVSSASVWVSPPIKKGIYVRHDNERGC